METGDPTSWDLTCRGDVFHDWHTTLRQGGTSLRLPRMADVVRDIERRIWEIEEHADVSRFGEPRRADKGKEQVIDVDEIDELMDETRDEVPRDKGKGKAVDIEDGHHVDKGLNDPPVRSTSFLFPFNLLTLLL